MSHPAQFNFVAGHSHMGCGASKSAAESVQEPVKPESSSSAGPEIDPKSLIGKKVRIKGLERREDLNGKEATVNHYIEERKRLFCHINTVSAYGEAKEEQISISIENVEQLS